jgi:2-phospho-L-lactate guanylyltransferase
MTTWAIIPVKPLHDSKRRLENLLSAEDRADLIYHFLDDLLAVLTAAPGIDRVLVVTADPSVIGLANGYGAKVLLEAETTGLNAAVAQGAAYATVAGATAVLILPADLPFARAEDIEAMLRPLTAGKVTPVARGLIALTGDETEEGTNALLLAPPGDFTFHYGPGSFGAHLAEAEARRRAAYVINAPGLRFDLDTESDWLVYNGYLVGVGEE